MTVTVAWYMTLAAVLFVIGGTGLLLRRNALVMFMSIELMLNAVNLSFVAFSHKLDMADGQVFAIGDGLVTLGPLPLGPAPRFILR